MKAGFMTLKKGDTKGVSDLEVKLDDFESQPIIYVNVTNTKYNLGLTIEEIEALYMYAQKVKFK